MRFKYREAAATRTMATTTARADDGIVKREQSEKNEGAAVVVINVKHQPGVRLCTIVTLRRPQAAAAARRNAVSAMAMLRSVFFRADKRRAGAARVLLRGAHPAGRVGGGAHSSGRAGKWPETEGGRQKGEKKEGNFQEGKTHTRRATAEHLVHGCFFSPAGARALLHLLSLSRPPWPNSF